MNALTERFHRILKEMIRSYLADHPRDWDFYTAALTFIYTRQPHIITGLAPFELVLSRRLPPLAMEQPLNDAQTPTGVRNKWKYLLSKAMLENKGRMKITYAIYKNKCDVRLRRQLEVVTKGDHF